MPDEEAPAVEPEAVEDYGEINMEDQPTDEEIWEWIQKSRGVEVVEEGIGPEAQAAEEPAPLYPSNMHFGNQAPPNTEGLVLIGHPDTGGFQWTPEESFEDAWADVGWKRAAVNPDTNEAYILDEAEEEGEPSPQTTEEVES